MKILASITTVCAVFLASSLLWADEAGVALDQDQFRPLLNDEGQPIYLAQYRRRGKSLSRSQKSQLADALALSRDGQFKQASKVLFRLSRKPGFAREKMQIKYILGLMLFELQLNQVSAFQLVDVIRDGRNRYTKQALQKLSFAADRLGDETLLNYAISKINIRNFPDTHKDMLNFRIGEYKLNAEKFRDAAKHFSRVRKDSRYYYRAKYNEGLTYAERNQTKRALSAFNDLLNARSGSGITDDVRVAAVLSKARVYYQQKKWDEAIKLYRSVPRDTSFWHEALFESSWALLRSARFRSALSNFQSLHSAFYENRYLPESLLLRAIVYLYICKYREMEKVLAEFERIYGGANKKISRFIAKNTDPMKYYNELEEHIIARKNVRKNGRAIGQFQVPYLIGRKVLGEGDVSKALNYLYELQKEKRRLDRMPSSWRSASIGTYAYKIISTRVRNTKKLLGKMVKSHFMKMRSEIRDLTEQAGFIRFEMLNGKKEQLKKKLSGKSLAKAKTAEESRDYYVQNGYEYWPFQGENWLDEIGNYHYLGNQSCE